MLIHNLCITLNSILKKERKYSREGWKEKRVGKESEQRYQNASYSCDRKSASNSDSQYLPSFSSAFLCFPLSSLGVFVLSVHSPGFCLHHPLCFCLSSFRVCLPLYVFPFTCLKCHVSTQHTSKSYSKANMKFYNCKFFTVLEIIWPNPSGLGITALRDYIICPVSQN